MWRHVSIDKDMFRQEGSGDEAGSRTMAWNNRGKIPDAWRKPPDSECGHASAAEGDGTASFQDWISVSIYLKQKCATNRLNESSECLQAGGHKKPERRQCHSLGGEMEEKKL